MRLYLSLAYYMCMHLVMVRNIRDVDVCENKECIYRREMGADNGTHHEKEDEILGMEKYRERRQWIINYYDVVPSEVIQLLES